MLEILAECWQDVHARVVTMLQILEIKTESPDVINALSTLSGIYTDNTPAARRQLRCTIEQRGLQINGQFLQAAEAVMQVGWRPLR